MAPQSDARTLYVLVFSLARTILSLAFTLRIPNACRKRCVIEHRSSDITGAYGGGRKTSLNVRN
jgi:hypothetical protein